MYLNYSIFDVETDGLYEEATKIHCLCAKVFRNGVLVETLSLIDYNSMIDFLKNEEVLIGHNIIRFDIPVLEKLLGMKISAKLVDTLGLSWYLYPMRDKHGLEEWGESLGIEKPKIADWSNLTVEEYLHRCTEDVKINSLLWEKEVSYLQRLYEGNDITRIIGYLGFKLDCAREQEMVKWKLDVDLCISTLNKLLLIREEKFELVSNIMPSFKKYKIVNKPKSMYKKDGNLSEAGKRWIQYLNVLKLPLDYSGEELKVVDKEEKGNPGSSSQIKDWLFSLGWKPCTYSYTKNKKTGVQRKIPQVYDPNTKELTKSVKVLMEKVPELSHLDGLTIVKHRIGILEGFLKNKDSDNFLKAEIKGFTNTLRFQHTTIVNLPTIHKPYGKEIRGCLIAPDQHHVLCGSDMSSLEDNTKQHFMYFYDPEYVKEMRVPGFSPHLDIGVQGGMITQEESDFYKWFDATKANDEVVLGIYNSKVSQRYLEMSIEDQEKEFKRISGIRKDSKQVNFSAVYGVGGPKLSLTTGWELDKSNQLLNIYWQRNWSVKEISKKTTHKTLDGQMWLWNPVSQFWYSLRYEKDKFSTLNQGTGVYCFDTWVRNVRRSGNLICGQFHDEIISPTLKGQEEQKREQLLKAIEDTNKELSLNIELGISIDFGLNYAQIH